MRRFRVTLFAVQEQYYIFRVCVHIALVIQNVKCMQHIIFSSVTSLVVPWFSTLSHKLHDFRGKKFTERKLGVVITFITFIWNISHFKMSRVMYDKYT
jgi:hypothetical protein